MSINLLQPCGARPTSHKKLKVDKDQFNVTVVNTRQMMEDLSAYAQQGRLSNLQSRLQQIDSNIKLYRIQVCAKTSLLSREPDEGVTLLDGDGIYLFCFVVM